MSKESKLELLDQLEEKVELLHAQTKETRKCLEAATERISSDGVLEVTRIDSIRKLLSEVKALTLTSSSLLSELGSDAVPASFSEFSEEIEGLRRLLDKSVYIEAREFLLRLRIHDENIAELFAKVKEDLLSMDIESMSASDCEEKLGDYVMLRNLLDPATENSEKVGYITKLSGSFDQRILGLAFGDAYTVEEASALDDYKKEESRIADGQEIIPVRGDDPVSEDDFGDDVTSSGEALPLNDDEDKSPYRILAEIADYPVGVGDGVNVSVTETASQASKAFSIKKFKESLRGEYLSKGCRRIMANLGFNMALPWGTEENPYIDVIEKKTEVNLNECQEFLLRKGYVRKLSAEGYPPICVLTKKGLEIFKSKSGCEFIGFKYNPDNKHLYVPATFEAYQTMLCRCHAWRLLKMSYSSSDAVAVDFQIVVMALEPDRVMNVLVTNACPKDTDEFEEYLELFTDSVDGLNFKDVLIYGATIEEARKLADIVVRIAGESIDPEETEIKLLTPETPIGDNEDVKVTAVTPAKDMPSEEYNCPYCNQPLQEIVKYDGEVFYGHEGGWKADAPCKHTFGSLEEITGRKGASEAPKKPDRKKKADSSEPKAEKKKMAATDSRAKTEESEPVQAAADSKPSAQKPRKPVDNEVLKRIEQKVSEYASDGKIYCATAYATAAAIGNPDAEGLRDRLAYAVNDPAAHCIYTSDNLFSVYTAFSSQADYYYQTSAVLRLFFAGQARYDYNLQAIHDSINGSPALENNKALNDLIYTLREFKTKTGYSVDKYADYRSRDRVALEKDLANIRKEASSHYINDVEQQRMIRTRTISRRYEETWKGMFSKSGDVAVYLKAVADDDAELLELAADYVGSTFIKEGLPVSPENIDMRAIEQAIDDAWDNAGSRVSLVMKSSTLMGPLRNNMRQHLLKVVSCVCEWIEIHETLGDSRDSGYEAYTAIRSKVLDLARNAMDNIAAAGAPEDVSARAGINVLTRTISEISRKVDGSYKPSEHAYFYKDFLKDNYVILDEAYMPDYGCSVPLVSEMDMLRLIEKHASNEDASIEDNLSDYCHDNFRSAGLAGNYIEKFTGKMPEIMLTLDEAAKYAEGQIEFSHRDFVSDLELAQSYGQLDADESTDRKDSLLRLADHWYEWATETHNYGFYKDLLEEMRAQIRTDAEGRGVAMNIELTSLLTANPELERDHAEYVTKIRAMIDKQNYLVSEDMINHLLAGDIPSDVDLFEEDYLADFHRSYDYYYRLAGKSGQALSNLVKTNDLRSLTSKEQKGALNLKNSWPNPGKSVTTEALKTILTTLGIDAEKVAATDIANSVYSVRVKKPLHEDEQSYGHPIYGFGSRAARDGFRVLWLSGAYSADALLTKQRELGRGKHTIAFLDHAMTESERRRLARKIKEDGLSSIFMVIDRVLYMYLIHNYSEATVRMLMETAMPYSFFQPYISDSATVMPPEMFIGRKAELEKIKDPAGVNILYGGRQLGKSALLRKAKADIDRDPEGDRALLIDIKDLDYEKTAVKISQALFDEGIINEPIDDETSWDDIARAIRKVLNGSHKIHYLLLMLDEADAFLASCEEVGYSPFNALKDIQQNVEPGRFKFVVAGLRNVVRFTKAATSGNSVLPHLESLTIKPFTTVEGRMLLEEPLYYLGFRFPEENMDLVPMILATTNYFPGLIQLYCSKLITALRNNYGGYNEAETPPYVVSEELIKKVLAESDFRAQIREKFMITLMLGDDDYYYILALILAYLYRNYDSEDGYTAAEILDVAKEFEISRIADMTVEQVQALMTELRELNVVKEAGHKYLFARYNFSSMLGSAEEVDDKLLSYTE